MLQLVKYFFATLFFVATLWTTMTASPTTPEDLSPLVAKLEAEIIDLKDELCGVKQDLTDVRERCYACKH